jgi:hypothetical protein
MSKTISFGLQLNEDIQVLTEEEFILYGYHSLPHPGIECVKGASGKFYFIHVQEADQEVEGVQS